MKITQPRTDHDYRQLVTNTSAGGTSITPPSPLVSTDVQAIIDEIQAEIDAGAGVTVREADNSPSVLATVLVVPSGSEDVLGTVATLHLLTSRGGSRGELDARSVAGAITLDLAAYNAFQLTLTGNVTSVTLSNPPPSGADAFWAIALVQGGSGGYTFAWPGSVKWRASDGTDAGSPPTLSTAVGAQDDFDLSSSDGGTTYGATPGNVSGFTAGGDLTGTSTSQTVAKINGSALGTTSGASIGDRLRWDGSGWTKSALIWKPVTVYDGTHWQMLVDGSGDAIMAEV